MLSLLIRRELRASLRNPQILLQPVLFFTLTICLFPLASGADNEALARIAPAALWIALLLAALLAASAVSAAGMLGFVGLVVPHMVRLLTGSDFDYLLPAAAIWGAALIAGADAAARMAFAPVEIPVGVFMSFLGAPFFLYLLKKGLRRE